MIILLFMQLMLSTGRAQTLDELVQQAEVMGLASQSGWLNLLHYKSHVFGREHSQADDDAFFLDRQGNTDAMAELVADLEAFYLPFENEQHAQCRFPARLHWLDSQLKFSQSLPRVECKAFEQWQQGLNAEGVSLLFPSMYLNNPASMFGHSFLRFDNPDTSALLRYTLSYGAATDAEDGPVAYVYKGLSGGYSGVFTVRPYYETVQEYGDIEHRDIWEYPLNLTKEETAQLLRHAWEVRGIHFDYYFLRENCSYRLLAMLDVARPGIDMSRQSYALYAVPVDTVRDVAAAGLIAEKKYRPAQHSRILQMYQQLEPAMQQQVLAMLDQPAGNIKSLISGYPELQQIQLIELAYEISSFKNDQPERDHNLLKLRSELPANKGAPAFSFQQPAPETGHDSARWSVALGEQENEVFYSLEIRPVLHGLMDPGEGFIQGASISVLDTELRWYRDEQQLRLHRLEFFSVQSLLPVQPWSAPVSAGFAVSLQQRPFAQDIDHRVFMLDATLGYSLGDHRQLWFVLAELRYEASHYFEQDYVLGMGIHAGALFQFQHGRLKLDLQSLTSVGGDELETKLGRGQYQFDISRDQALALEYQYEDVEFAERKTVGLRYIKYF